MSKTHKDSLTQSMKLPRDGWFQTKASNLVDLNQLGWLAMDLFKKKILEGT